MINSLAKTRKVLLLLTANFLKRIHELLGDEDCILKKLDKMRNNREIDVIILFVEAVALNPEKHAVLVKFDNVDSSSYGLEWNYLRKLLIRPLQLDTTRDAGLPFLLNSSSLTVRIYVKYLNIILVFRRKM